MGTHARIVLTLLVTTALSGCAVREAPEPLDSGATEPSSPVPVPVPEVPAVAATPLGVADLPPRPEPPSTATRQDDECPYMPTAGLVRPQVRRSFDWDSIRALTPEALDSLAAAGELPRSDSVIVVPESAPATRMPIVPLDPAASAIRVVPLCRVARTGR